MLTIRALDTEDIPHVAEWVVRVPLWQRYGLTVERLGAALHRALETDLLLTADLEVRAVGLAWCVPQGAFARSAYLKMLGVHPDQAGAGIGARLLDEVEAQVTSDDLFLLASDFNIEAQRFYLRQGYQQVGTLPGYVLPDVAEVILRKRLR